MRKIWECQKPFLGDQPQVRESGINRRSGRKCEKEMSLTSDGLSRMARHTSGQLLSFLAS
eukprot:CAMPEP_0175995358 /NCGR_PEP_ID=MMETSP0108-20121206/55085_1 /TAXON_ID=195067 ORGANISM="Goniomonas pacifica, Strain CCMP1869" /NCGR_SAMPLE_ID=MMETSP0108 /ASSEMBLY_ACC=CAM_ASM_000204 /LENGTH=59 /DNA_ID=CAMNT_0017327467 /DNA_START=419 /DNA_END=595 /DNA_ORIENTATION=+